MCCCLVFFNLKEQETHLPKYNIVYRMYIDELVNLEYKNVQTLTDVFELLLLLDDIIKGNSCINKNCQTIV